MGGINSKEPGGCSTGRHITTRRDSRVKCLEPERKLTLKDVEDLLEEIDKVIIYLSKESSKGSVPKKVGFSELWRGNLQAVSTVFEKLGGASRTSSGQGTSTESDHETSQLASEALCALSGVFKGVGNLHLAGALLCVLAAIIDRCHLAKQNRADLIKLLKMLKPLGKEAIELQRDLQRFDLLEEDDENMRAAFELVCRVGKECIWRTKTSKLKNMMYAMTDNEKLNGLEKEIERLCRNLCRTAGKTTMKQLVPPMRGQRIQAPEGMVGNHERTKKQVAEIEKLIHPIASHGIGAVVVHGMPGVGTSTLGDLVAVNLGKEFSSPRSFCKLNMRDANLAKKQEEMYEKLSGRKASMMHTEHGREELKAYFEGRQEPILIFMDNVENGLQITELLPDELNVLLPSGSILLVTTHNATVCEKIAMKGITSFCHEVKVLEGKDAEELFRRAAFGEVSPHKDLEMLMDEKEMRKLLEVCGGLPLALVNTGHQFFYKGHRLLSNEKNNLVNSNRSLTSVYEDVSTPPHVRRLCLEKLKIFVRHALTTLLDMDSLTSRHDPLLQSFELAYEQLDPPRLREVFLDIAAVHVGRSWTDVELLYGEDLELLEEQSMIEKVEVSYWHKASTATVGMHSLLDALARKKLADNTTQRVIAKHVNKLPRALKDTRKGSPEIIRISHSKDPLPVRVLARAAEKLRYLELRNVEITGTRNISPNALVYLKAENVVLPFSISRLENLRILYLASDSRLQKIESLPRLIKLEISSSTLEKLGSGLPSLQHVTLYNCPVLTSLGPLSPNIRTLTIIGCPNLDNESFSTISGLKRLEELCLMGWGCSLADHHKDVHTLDLSKYSSNEVFKVKHMPQFVVPPSVQSLDLSFNTRLKEIPQFAPGSSLKILHARQCPILKQLPEAVLTLPNLEDLSLRDCLNLKKVAVPDKTIFRNLRLNIDVRGCPALEDLSKLQQFAEDSNSEIQSSQQPFSRSGCRLNLKVPFAHGVWDDIRSVLRMFYQNGRRLYYKVASHNERKDQQLKRATRSAPNPDRRTA